MVQLGNDWDGLLRDQWQEEYYLALRSFLKEQYATRRIYPPMHDIFNALRYTSFAETKLVILGQDPYHGAGQAHGLCFSVREGVPMPPSLQNIFKELQSDLGVPIPQSGELTRWAKQGVLLLNTTLTVPEGQPMGHKGRGWEILTDRIISLLNEKKTPVVFLLWGAHAQKKAELITNPMHRKLKTVHPSPLSASRGFFGCKHFSRANAILRESGQEPIEW